MRVSVHRGLKALAELYRKEPVMKTQNDSHRRAGGGHRREACAHAPGLHARPRSSVFSFPPFLSSSSSAFATRFSPRSTSRASCSSSSSPRPWRRSGPGAGLAAGAARSRNSAATPRAVWLAPAMVVLACLAEMAASREDQWATRMIGHNAVHCLMLVPIMALAPLAGLFLALKHGAPSDPRGPGRRRLSRPRDWRRRSTP